MFVLTFFIRIKGFKAAAHTAIVPVCSELYAEAERSTRRER
jgi:hypothetical protein